MTGLDEFIPGTNFDDNTDDDPDGININELECKPVEYKLKGLKLVKQKHPKIIQSVRYHRDKDRKQQY